MLYKTIKDNLYNERTRHLGFFNVDLKFRADTKQPVVLEISNGTRGLYRPVDNASEDSIPHRFWQWLYQKAPAYYFMRDKVKKDQNLNATYNEFYDLDYMRSLPGNRSGTHADFLGDLLAQRFNYDEGVLVNHDIAGPEYSAALMNEMKGFIFLNGIGLMNDVLVNKIATWQLFEETKLNAYTPMQSVIPKSAVLLPGFMVKLIDQLPGDRFIIKPPMGRNGLGIMSFERSESKVFFDDLAKRMQSINPDKLPLLDTHNSYYYDEPARYWAQDSVRSMIIQEFVPGLQYNLGCFDYEQTVRVAVGVDFDLSLGKHSLDVEYLGGYTYLPPQPLGYGSWQEQYISNHFRRQDSVMDWHRALRADERASVQEFLQEQFPLLYFALLRKDVIAFKKQVR